MKSIVILSAALSMILCPAAAGAQGDVWVGKDSGPKNAELKTAILNSDSLYIATRSALYRAKDLKERWESVFSLPSGGNNEINCVAGRAKTIFVGTKRGLFKSEDYGVSWKNVFRTILPGKNNITYIELSKHNRYKVLIATEKGIFLSEDLGETWKDISGALKNISIKCLALNKESMYAGTEGGLYVMRFGTQDWERLFAKSAIEKKEYEEAPDAPEGETEKDTSIRCIAITNGRVYIAFEKQMFYTDDGAKSWNSFPGEGLKGSINYMLISQKNKKLYCATSKGVFEFSDERSRWLELYRGMARSFSVSHLIFSAEDEKAILAVTDKGLYAFEGGDYLIDKYQDIDKSLKTLKVAFDGEPAFKELQQAAIRFCDVDPEKIRGWQRDSRIKAIVPKLSFGMDNHRSTNSTIYTSATRDYVAVGPDDIYNSASVSVSWDLGNLIWSDDQTNIDVRSRLMVQLGH